MVIDACKQTYFQNYTQIARQRKETKGRATHRGTESPCYPKLQVLCSNHESLSSASVVSFHHPPRSTWPGCIKSFAQC